MSKKLIGALVMVFAFSLVVAGNGSGKEAPDEQTKYPEKPITFILPLEAGSGGDILTRPLVEGAAKKLGQPIIVINKPGASGAIGLKVVHDAKPDGYTIGMTTSFVVTDKMHGVFPYNQNDFDMIGVFQTDPAVVVSTAKKPWKTIKEMADYAKAHPGEVSAATSSKGAIWWLAAVGLGDAIGAKLNIIPQAGAGGFAILQVSGGHSDLAVLGLPESKSQIDAGNVRLLAVMGPQRAPGKYSTAPTMKQAGFTGAGAEVCTFRSIFAPKDLPKPVFEKLVQAFGEVAQSEAYKKFLTEQNSQPLWAPGPEAVKIYEEQGRVFRPMLKNVGLLKEK